MKLDLSVSFLLKTDSISPISPLPNNLHSSFLFPFHNSSKTIRKNSLKLPNRQMGSETYVGFMAVVAVSSSVALVALQLHRRLASDYMKKIELILGGETRGLKKKVRFAPDVIEPSSNNKEYRKRRLTAAGH